MNCTTGLLAEASENCVAAGRNWPKSLTGTSSQRLAGPEKSKGAGGLRVKLPEEKRILFRDVGLAEGEELGSNLL